MKKRLSTVSALVVFAAFFLGACSGEVVKTEEKGGAGAGAGAKPGYSAEKEKAGQAGTGGVTGQDLGAAGGAGAGGSGAGGAGSGAETKQEPVVASTEGALVTPPSASGKEPVSIPELKTIHFDYDKSDIRSGDAAILKGNYQYLKTNTGRVLIEGHCDERGTNQYNLALGERRANAAKRYMADLGIDAGRMDIISYGEERPAVQGSTEEAWAQNRRAEFKAIR